MQNIHDTFDAIYLWYFSSQNLVCNFLISETGI